MADATVKIPAEHAEVFCREAVETLEHAAGALKEGADWFAEGKGKPGRLEEEDIPRTLEAISFVRRVRNGELEFGAEEVVRSTLEGLVINAGEQVRNRAEGTSPESVRQAIAELEVWLTLLDSPPMQEVACQREAKMQQAMRDREAVA